MSKKLIAAIILISLLLTILLISGCQAVVPVESGELVTRRFDFIGFTKVDLSDTFYYEITRSDEYSISITARESLFDHIKVNREGQTVKIDRDRSWALFNIDHDDMRSGYSNQRVVITMPQCQALNGSGATHGIISSFTSGEDLDITMSGVSSLVLVKISAGDVTFDVSGFSNISGDLEAGNVTLDISGTSSVQLEGSASDIIVDASDFSRLILSAFTVDNADIILSGTSTGAINMDGRLDVDLSGVSSLEYIGEPDLGNINISSSSRLSQKSR